MWTSHSPGRRYEPFKSITIALWVGRVVPPSRISEIRSSSMIIVAWVLGSGLTQSITLQLVSINLKFFTPILKIHSGQDQNLLRLGVDDGCE